MAGVPENGRKKRFSLAKKSVFTSRNKVFFHKLDFPISSSRKKSLNKRILFQLNRKLVSTRGNGEFRGKTASIDRSIRKVKKMVANDRVLNRLLYNLNNRFY